MFVRYLPLFVSLIMICPFSEGCSSILLGSTPIRGGTIVKAPERALPATATKHLQRFPPVDYADIGDFNPEKKNLLVVSYPLQHISHGYHITPQIWLMLIVFSYFSYLTSPARKGMELKITL
jgi:hypothetical protein